MLPNRLLRAPTGVSSSVVVGPSMGELARRVVLGLLRAGVGVTLVHPDPRDVADLVGLGATLVRADPERPTTLRTALLGASALVWIPRAEMLVDRPGRAMALAEVAGMACHESSVCAVVSSIAGRRLGWQRGGPSLLRAIESVFLDRVADVTVLRSGVFMEHLLALVRDLRRRGVLALPIRPEQDVPLVAIADVARRLVDFAATPGGGQSIHELRGPEEFSPPEIAAAIAAASWGPVAFDPLDPDAAVGHFTTSGLDAADAAWLASLCEAANAGLLDPPRPRIHELSADITLERWIEDTLSRAAQRTEVGAV